MAASRTPKTIDVTLDVSNLWFMAKERKLKTNVLYNGLINSNDFENKKINAKGLMTFRVPGNTTLGDLKRKIQDVLKIPVEKQRLSAGGVEVIQKIQGREKLIRINQSVLSHFNTPLIESLRPEEVADVALGKLTISVSQKLTQSITVICPPYGDGDSISVVIDHGLSLNAIKKVFCCITGIPPEDQELIAMFPEGKERVSSSTHPFSWYLPDKVLIKRTNDSRHLHEKELSTSQKKVEESRSELLVNAEKHIFIDFIRRKVESTNWDIAGKSFLGFFNPYSNGTKTPTSIKKLRDCFAPYPEDHEFLNQKQFDTLYEAVKNIITTIKPNKRRSFAVEDFYQTLKAGFERINPSIKTEKEQQQTVGFEQQIQAAFGNTALEELQEESKMKFDL